MSNPRENKRVGVLMGGISHEREVSLKTGRAVCRAMREEGYDVVGLNVSFDIVERLLAQRVDVAFIALHGRWGEDGTVQGLLELLQIPYTGSGVLASALAMNKIKSKELFVYHGIPTPPFVVPPPHDSVQPPFPLPWVVKPASEGSTIGIHIVRETEGLAAAVNEARDYDREVLIEQFISGRELTVGILNGNPLPVIEVVPKEGFYDYRAKYTAGMTDYIIPAEVSDDVMKAAQDVALRSYATLGCNGCARVDLRMAADAHLFVTELNTLPGMTDTSLVPKAAAYQGLTFNQLVVAILEDASLKVQTEAV